MKILKHGIEVTVNKKVVGLYEGDGIFTDNSVIKVIEKIYGREVEQIYILENDCCYPNLLVEWKYWLNDINQYTVLDVECTESELSLFYEMQIL